VADVCHRYRGFALGARHPQTMQELGQQDWQLYDPSAKEQYPEYFNN
jgi:hypothetical protein